MTVAGLSFIADMLVKNDIDYCFGEWSGNVVYPYWVGEYIESETVGECGESEAIFILTGTTNKTWLSLEKIKEKICSIFPSTGFTHIFENKNGIAICYETAFCIPTNTVNFKRIQINLKVKEWSVN